MLPTTIGKMLLAAIPKHAQPAVQQKETPSVTAGWMPLALLPKLVAPAMRLREIP